MTGIAMFDSILNGQFPANPQAVAGYVDGGEGDQPNAAWLAQAFPQAHHLSIALFAANDADALDVESGASEPADIPGWHVRQQARGIARPVIYANAFTMDAEVLPVLAAAGIARASTRLWSAHYTGEAHICSASSCGATLTAMDGTQWTSAAMGRTLDQSLLLDNFFGAPPVPDPSWMEKLMQSLPTVREGSTGGIVRTIQGLSGARGHAVTIDGSFGPATLAAVKSVQAGAHIAQDGIVGPQTWEALIGVA